MTRQLEALDRQFDKYGHEATLLQGSSTIPTKVLGANFKTLYQSGTTIVNPNYRLFLRPVKGSDDITLSTNREAQYRFDTAKIRYLLLY